jgi:hypothetical protein
MHSRIPEGTRAGLLVLLHAFESLFKLGDQRSFTVLETIASHDAPEKIADRFLVPVHDQQIFGRPAGHEDDDIGLGAPVHDRQFASLLNGVLDSADRVAIFVGIKLISVIGSYVELARIRQSARKRRHLRHTWIGRGRGGNPVRIKLIAKRGSGFTAPLFIRWILLSFCVLSGQMYIKRPMQRPEHNIALTGKDSPTGLLTLCIGTPYT